MADWTTEQIEERLTEAADVLKRLPEERVRGYCSTWPVIVYSFADIVGQTPEPMRRPPPLADSITHMEETLNWIQQFLAPEDARLVWARANGARWRVICWRFGIARATAHRRWQYCLSVIALRLNGRRIPAKRSQSFVIHLATRLSRANG